MDRQLNIEINKERKNIRKYNHTYQSHILTLNGRDFKDLQKTTYESTKNENKKNVVMNRNRLQI